MVDKILDLFFEKVNDKKDSCLTVLTQNRKSEVKFLPKIKKTSLSKYFRTSKGLNTDRSLGASFSRSRTVSLKSVDFYRI